MFWKKNLKNVPATKENRIDALANRLQKEGKIDFLERELLQFNPDSLQGLEKESWYHLYGIVPFRLNDRPLAFTRFSEGIKHCPESASLAFSLGQEHEFRGEIEAMFACFDRAVFPKISAAYALAKARYAYLWDNNEKGISYVVPLLPAYFKLGILDDHFLYMRGLPFFQQTWAYLAAFSQLKGDYTQIEEITKKAAAQCTDFNFDTLFTELHAIKTGEFSDVRKSLRKSIEDAGSGNWPLGYQRIKGGIIDAQETGNYQDAERILDSIPLEERDFKWLSDMRLLAKCEAAHKSGDAELESRIVTEFLKHQPMLFEPDNAINFNLLRYQETLKGQFRNARQVRT